MDALINFSFRLQWRTYVFTILFLTDLGLWCNLYLSCTEGIYICKVYCILHCFATKTDHQFSLKYVPVRNVNLQQWNFARLCDVKMRAKKKILISLKRIYICISYYILIYTKNCKHALYNFFKNSVLLSVPDGCRVIKFNLWIHSRRRYVIVFQPNR